MSKKDLTLTKYQMVKDYVLSQIENQEFTEEDRIPSESEFSKLLDVSTITVRKALSELVNEGVIYRIRGKGASSPVKRPSRKRPRIWSLSSFPASNCTIVRICRS